MQVLSPLAALLAVRVKCLKGDKKPQTFFVAKVYVEVVLLFETLVAPAGPSFVCRRARLLCCWPGPHRPPSMRCASFRLLHFSLLFLP